MEEFEKKLMPDLVSLFELTDLIESSDATKKQKGKMHKQLKKIAITFGGQRRIIDDSEEREFLGFAECFPFETPTLVFSKWESILEIKQKVAGGTDSNFKAEAKREFYGEDLNCYAANIYGRTIMFVDELDIIPFLRILQSDKPKK
jgi:hypothetical protein